MEGETVNQSAPQLSECQLTKIYKLHYCVKENHQKENNNGNNGSTSGSSIFHGTFEKNNNPVFIRRFNKIHKGDPRRDSETEENNRDVSALLHRVNLHENFIRFLTREDSDHYSYVATEWCICSVEDIYRKNANGTNWIGQQIPTESIKELLKSKQILWQATKGLEFLHCAGYVHRNLKPSNFMIAEVGNEYKVKLSDFRLSKKPKEQRLNTGQMGSNGWVAPINPSGKNVAEKDEDDYFSDDVFVLGCFFHFVWTNGLHPFGNGSIERVERINSSRDLVYDDTWNPSLSEKNEQAVFLLKQMIEFDPKKRCKLTQVLDCHYFLSERYYNLYDIPGGLGGVRPGLCVIFNQEIFENAIDNRMGSEFDEKKLVSVFKAFGFDVEIFRDLKAKDLLYYTDDLIRRDFSEYASLVVCILSHGDENVVKGTDFKNVNIDDLKYKFNSHNCPSLNGKPKIWIVQACQGHKSQGALRKPNTQLTTEWNSTTDNILSSKPNESSNFLQIQRRYTRKIIYEETMPPTEQVNKAAQENFSNRAPIMDFLDIRATIRGFVAVRFENWGSLLIQHLCTELENEYLGNTTSSSMKSKDLEVIINRVQDIISNETIALLDAKKTKCEINKQTIVRIASLSGRIKFKKAHLPGIVTLRRIDRCVGLLPRLSNWLCRFLLFVSTPAHYCFYRSWDDGYGYDRELDKLE